MQSCAKHLDNYSQEYVHGSNVSSVKKIRVMTHDMKIKQNEDGVVLMYNNVDVQILKV